MGIENLKRWHWLAIGLLLGAILAWVRVKYSDDLLESRLPRDNIEQQTEFENLVQYRAIADITVYPWREGGRKNASEKNKSEFGYIVTCRAPVNHKRIAGYLGLGVAFKLGPYAHYSAPNPYVPLITLADDKKLPPDATVLDFLKAVDTGERAKGRPGLSYRFAWWTLPKWIYAFSMGGGAVVVGGIWPFIVNLLIGAGFGRPPKPKEDYDLSRFKGEPDEKKEEAKALVTQVDLDKLTALEKELEANLAAEASARPSRGRPAVAAQGPVRKLAGAPAEPVKVAEKSRDGKDYGLTQADFYPTEVHGKKRKA